MDYLMMMPLPARLRILAAKQLPQTGKRDQVHTVPGRTLTTSSLIVHSFDSSMSSLLIRVVVKEIKHESLFTGRWRAIVHLPLTKKVLHEDTLPHCIVRLAEMRSGDDEGSR